MRQCFMPGHWGVELGERSNAPIAEAADCHQSNVFVLPAIVHGANSSAFERFSATELTDRDVSTAFSNQTQNVGDSLW